MPVSGHPEADELALPELRIEADGEEALANLVYRELREAICDNRLKSGQRLVQNTLADHLGLSRTPVRDALLRLSAEGLVRASQWRGGFVVSPFTVREVLDIYDVRLPLEVLAIGEAAGHHSRAQLAHLRDLNQRLAGGPGDDVGEQYRLNRELHAGMIAPSENEILKRMIDQLWSMPSSLRMYYRQIADRASADESVAQHADILDALEAGDADGAGSRLRHHLETAKQEAVELLERPDP